jgi:D-alanine-D-alanine ligase
MPGRKLDVLVLFDVPYAPPNHLAWREFMVGDEWKDERDVIRALTRLGHRVSAFGVYDDVAPLVAQVARAKPDVIFNLCETFRADRAHEPNLPAVLELLGVPYTGARSEALALCKDKGLTKKVVSFHDVRVPRFAVVPRADGARAPLTDVVYPALCKPLGLDASEGIAQSSLVKDEESCRERLRFVHEKLASDAIVEEYIAGRELYVAVLGNERLTVLPPRELFFKNLPSGSPQLLTFRAKWDEAYRRKYGIDSRRSGPLPAATLARMNAMARTVYRLFKITGYARIDLRLDAAGEPVFIEVNPNPSIKRADDFAGAARRAGIGYDELLGRIVNLALAG